MIKLCINCVHCKKREPSKTAQKPAVITDRPHGYYCVRPLSASPVDGSPRHNETMCEDERRTGEACGPDGYYYVGAKP